MGFKLEPGSLSLQLEGPNSYTFRPLELVSYSQTLPQLACNALHRHSPIHASHRCPPHRISYQVTIHSVFQGSILVLAAAARRIGSGHASKPNEDVASASGPISDATGVVKNCAEHYLTGRWVDPGAFVKSSDSVEQSIEGFVLHGISYGMDFAWLEKHNSTAKGEGFRSAAHHKDRQEGCTCRAAIPRHHTENKFEFVMGLFEKITDEERPYLHLVSQGYFWITVILNTSHPSLPHPGHLPSSRPSKFPPTAVIQPTSPNLHELSMYWKERKIAREGHTTA